MAKKTARKKAESPMSTMSVAASPAPSNELCVCASCPTSHAGWGLMLLRVIAGAVFLLHGIGKFMTISGVMGFFSGLGIPGWFGWLVAAAEVLAGIALIVGFYTRWAGYLIALIMTGAFVFAGFGWGALGWLVVLAAAVGMLWLEKGPWACWLLGIVVALVVIVALWKSIAAGIVPAANVSRDLTLLAVGLLVAWKGPGKWSVHDKCTSCTH